MRKEQVRDLIAWQENTNITTYVAWRHRGVKWLFVRTDYLKENDGSYSISRKSAEKYSVGLEDILKTPLSAKPETMVADEVSTHLSEEPEAEQVGT